MKFKMSFLYSFDNNKKINKEIKEIDIDMIKKKKHYLHKNNHFY